MCAVCAACAVCAVCATHALGEEEHLLTVVDVSVGEGQGVEATHQATRHRAEDVARRRHDGRHQALGEARAVESAAKLEELATSLGDPPLRVHRLGVDGEGVTGIDGIEDQAVGEGGIPPARGTATGRKRESGKHEKEKESRAATGE